MRRGLVKLKVSIDDEPIIKVKTNNAADLDGIFNTVKKKLGVGKK